jgi:hypothetical protein
MPSMASLVVTRLALPVGLGVKSAAAVERCRRRCSFDVAVGPIQRNHSVADVMRIDIAGPPDVGRRRSQVLKFSFGPGLAPGLFFAGDASLIRSAAL